MGVVVALSMLCMVLGIGWLVDGFAQRDIVDRLESARTSFGRYLAGKYQLLESIVASAAENSRLKTVLDTGSVDRQAAAATVAALQQTLGNDVVLVTDRHGFVLADTSDRDEGRHAISAPAVLSTALTGERYSGLVEGDRDLYVVACAPVTIGPQLLGAILVGERIDATVANEFRKAVGSDILILNGRRHAIAWSPPTSASFDPHRLAALVEDCLAHTEGDDGNRGSGFERFKADGMDRFMVAQRLGYESAVAFTYSASELGKLESYLWRWLVGIALMTAAAAVAVSRWIARRVSQPLQELVDAAGKIAEGQLDIVVSEDGMLESARMGRAFNRMVGEVRRLLVDGDEKAGALQAQRDELDWANQMKSNFLSSASHELRTPITNIVSSARILLEHGGDEQAETRREFLEIIDAEANRLTRLIDQLFTVTHVASSNTILDMDEFDLVDAVEESVQEFARRYASDRVVSFRFDGTGRRYKGDRAHLQQALQQLLENAAKFDPDNGPIDVLLEQDGAAFRLRVADRGPGVPDPRSRERIFERFVQGGEVLTDKPTGVGLGLSLSRDIAIKHGGSLHHEERRDGGSEFVLTLPD